MMVRVATFQSHAGDRAKEPMMRRLLFTLIVLAAGGGVVPAALAAEFTPGQRAEIVAIVRDALKQDPSILRDAITALQADDETQQSAAAHNAIAQLHDALITPADPIAGNPHGDVTIVEFFDTRCPYCRRMEPAMQTFLEQDKKVRLVFKDLPILGPESLLGSKALLAAQKQGAYVRMRDAVMKLPRDTNMQQLQDTAHELGLDWPRMAKDMEDPAIQARLNANIELARKLGVQGTPALVIGSEMVPGAVDLPDLQKAVAAARHG
jgi:protein-disulfide isomerase